MTHPKPTDSNLDHALAYHALGWWVFPGRDGLDQQEFRNSLIRQGKTDEEAHQHTERSRKSTFVRWAERRKMGEAGRPTEAEIRDWFDASRPERPVIILTGPGATAGGQLVGVDVDVLKGGDEAPWTGPEVTMLARTPTGGCHAYHFAPDSEMVKSSANVVAEGIDIRGAGGLLVAPSGIVATQGRTWERWGPLSPAPLAEIRRRLDAQRPASVPRLRAPVAEGDEDIIPDAPLPGAFVRACTMIAPKGKRQWAVTKLIGVLARRGALPADAVFAALDLLREHHADLADETLDLLADGWRDALESSERSLTFATKVLRAWNALRVSPSWSDEELMDRTRRLWTKSTAGESAAQQADDDDDEEDGPRVDVFNAPPPANHGLSDGSDVYVDRGKVFSRISGREILIPPEEMARAILQTRRQLYGAKQFRDKLATPILSCGDLPPWMAITAAGVVPDLTSPHGHGFGPAIDVALAGGLRPGQLILLGAKTAKAGKTAAADQLIDGVQLRSVEALAKLTRGEKTDELIVVRYDFSEMGEGDLTDRQLGRWLGIDSTTFRRGKQAHLAPGIQRRSRDLRLTPHALADVVLTAGEATLEEGTLADLRDLQVMPDIDGLPSRSDEQFKSDGKTVFTPLDYQSGELMLRKMVEYIKIDRRLRAEQWGILESQICPLIFVDPIQRYQGSGAGAVEALDGFAKALKETAVKLPCIVIATSDTNKDNATNAAKRSATDKTGKDTRNQGERVASSLRGSYAGTTHAPDLTLMLEREDDDAGVKPGEPIKVRLSTGANRWLARSISIPLWFDPETGRYTPRAEDASPSEDDDDLIIPEPPPELPPIDVAGLLTLTQAKVLQLYQAGKTEDEIVTLGAAKSKDAVQKHLYRVRHICDQAQGLPASTVPSTTNADLKRATL